MRLVAPAASQDGGKVRELEHIGDVQSIDVHVLLGKLVGAVQSLSDENEQLAGHNDALTRQIKERNLQSNKQGEQMDRQSEQIDMLTEQVAKQNEQMALLMNYTQSVLQGR